MPGDQEGRLHQVAERAEVRRGDLLLAVRARARVVREGRRRRGGRGGRGRGARLLRSQGRMEEEGPGGMPMERQGSAATDVRPEGAVTTGVRRGRGRRRATSDGGVAGMDRAAPGGTRREDDERACGSRSTYLGGLFELERVGLG